MNESSTELVRRWRGGDQDAATELYRRYVQRLLQAVNSQLPQRIKVRVEADDICQSVFRSMFRRLHSGEFAFQDDVDIWKLLVTVALNKLRNKVRHNTSGKRDVGRELASPAVAEPDAFLVNRLNHGPSSEEAIQFRELMENLSAQLSPAEQSLLELRMDGYNQQEIADRLKLSARTVRRMNDRLRDRLFETFRDDLPEGYAPRSEGESRSAGEA